MSTKKPTNSLVQVGKYVYVGKPQPTPEGGLSPNEQPAIILMFGWMGAHLPHLLKYTQKYDEMYPAATKILVRSQPEFFWSSAKTNDDALLPVVQLLKEQGCLPPNNGTKKPSVLVHAFSNGSAPPHPLALHHSVLIKSCIGGSWQLTTLSALLYKLYPLLSSTTTSPPSLPPTALILDSTPGSKGLQSTLKAFTASLSSRPLKLLIGALIILTYGVVKSWLKLRWVFWCLGVVKGRSGNMDMFERMKEGLNGVDLEGGGDASTAAAKGSSSSSSATSPTTSTPLLLPHLSLHPRTTPRLYIYSLTDALIPADQVRAHAAHARALGWVEVREEVYRESEHVRHVRSDEGRYWGAVRGVWEWAVGRAGEGGGELEEGAVERAGEGAEVGGAEEGEEEGRNGGVKEEGEEEGKDEVVLEDGQVDEQGKETGVAA
ncbi:hypothetical protein CC1G_06231 [Coprinopsis cinerea okayama7|uniref:Indole-diterpene biosynthesis protein PaxU n=1 Tax=Coprinopsis cinerea (strain Okayama-7 / 130 / ATCC MYA-4618 / FGSC 9003) TaxID=240176 RepID=A8NVB2_COPC7|nr:hypothetical protein CC1G_06231 [Coprinopsis cinerea okayama7\|eukprot:XP_001836644.2 hypothetical protein CC1G_06231 [Coprinopsis cinerea okayama7\